MFLLGRYGVSFTFSSFFLLFIASGLCSFMSLFYVLFSASWHVHFCNRGLTFLIHTFCFTFSHFYALNGAENDMNAF